MFSLSDADLAGSILGCADGPASFNATAHARGVRVTSVDPLYHFSAPEIQSRFDENPLTDPRAVVGPKIIIKDGAVSAH